jgi:hypothetical protein
MSSHTVGRQEPVTVNSYLSTQALNSSPSITNSDAEDLELVSACTGAPTLSSSSSTTNSEDDPPKTPEDILPFFFPARIYAASLSGSSLSEDSIGSDIPAAQLTRPSDIYLDGNLLGFSTLPSLNTFINYVYNHDDDSSDWGTENGSATSSDESSIRANQQSSNMLAAIEEQERRLHEQILTGHMDRILGAAGHPNITADLQALFVQRIHSVKNHLAGPRVSKFTEIFDPSCAYVPKETWDVVNEAIEDVKMGVERKGMGRKIKSVLKGLFNKSKRNARRPLD